MQGMGFWLRIEAIYVTCTMHNCLFLNILTFYFSSKFLYLQGERVRLGPKWDAMSVWLMLDIFKKPTHVNI